jgi:hypothetical protein
MRKTYLQETLCQVLSCDLPDNRNVSESGFAQYRVAAGSRDQVRVGC